MSKAIFKYDYKHFLILSSVQVRVCVCVRERESVCEQERVFLHTCVNIFEREIERERREREFVCRLTCIHIFLKVREKEGVYVCVCVSEMFHY